VCVLEGVLVRDVYVYVHMCGMCVGCMGCMMCVVCGVYVCVSV